MTNIQSITHTVLLLLFIVGCVVAGAAAAAAAPAVLMFETNQDTSPPSTVICESLGDDGFARPTETRILTVPSENLQGVVVFMDDAMSHRLLVEWIANNINNIVSHATDTSERRVHNIVVVAVGPSVGVTVASSLFTNGSCIRTSAISADRVPIVAVAAVGAAASERAAAAMLHSMIRTRFNHASAHPDHSCEQSHLIPLYTDHNTVERLTSWHLPLPVASHWTENAAVTEETLHIPATAGLRDISVAAATATDHTVAVLGLVILPSGCSVGKAPLPSSPTGRPSSHGDVAPFMYPLKLLNTLAANLVERELVQGTSTAAGWLACLPSAPRTLVWQTTSVPPATDDTKQRMPISSSVPLPYPSVQTLPAAAAAAAAATPNTPPDEHTRTAHLLLHGRLLWARMVPWVTPTTISIFFGLLSILVARSIASGSRPSDRLGEGDRNTTAWYADDKNGKMSNSSHIAQQRRGVGSANIPGNWF